MPRAPAVIISNWYHLTENLQASPKEFFASVERALEARQIPNAKWSRVTWPEGGAFSARREYLRVRRKDLIFDICAAPFGTGFFVSWWLGWLWSWLRLLLALFLLFIPIIGWYIIWRMLRITYYQIDTALMFQEAVHQAVQEVIDGMTSAKGLRALTELERKPILKGFSRR